MKVYISGAISGLPEEVYTKAFEDAEVEILRAHLEPVSPLKIIPECLDACGSDKTFKDGTYQHTWKCYMKADVIALVDCDAMVLLSGWEDSRGACVEADIASGLGIPIFYENQLRIIDRLLDERIERKGDDL